MMLCKHGPDLGFPAPTSKSGVTMNACNPNAGARETGGSLGSDGVSLVTPGSVKDPFSNKQTNGQTARSRKTPSVNLGFVHTHAPTHIHGTHIHTPTN